MRVTLRLTRRHPVVLVAGFALLFVGLLLGKPHFAAAAACTQPSTDYGNVSALSVNVGTGSTATYRVWTRMVASDATNNTYLLEVDGSSCYTVGGSGVQTYTSAQDSAGTYFSASSTNTSDWIHTQSNGSDMTVSLTSGAHTFKLIGNAPNVVVDRLIVTQDTTCQPQGVGDNCATPPDTTPPVVSITSPTSGASVSSPVNVAVNATDDSGLVQRVELYVDGSSTPYDTDISSPYNFVVSSLSPGTHTFIAMAYDPSGLSSSSSQVSVTVKDTTAPTNVVITSPTAGQSVSGTISMTATASDNVAVTKFAFTVDTNTPITVTSGSPGTASLDTTALSNGAHTVKVVAYDAANNASIASSSVSFTVNNSAGGDTTGPTVSFVAPLNNAILNADSTGHPYDSKNYAITASASDTSGIKQVVFKVDGTTIATDTTAPYSASYDLSTLSCAGTHTITAIATDNSANQNTTPVNISVKVTLAADLSTSPDCKVGLPDYAIFGGNYGKPGSAVGRSDINGDGTVNLPDWAIFGGSFGKQRP